MNLNAVESLLDIAIKAQIPALIYGVGGIGKTGFIKACYPESALLHAHEALDNPTLLHSVLGQNRVVIIENSDEKSFEQLFPILCNKTLFATPLTSTILFTSRTLFTAHKELIKIPFPKPTSEEWKGWAMRNGVHELITNAVVTKNLLEHYTPRELETLSDMLKTGIPSDRVILTIQTLFGNDPMILELIEKGYDTSIDFDQVIGMETEQFVSKLQQTTTEELQKFNHDLLDELRFDPSIITKEKLITYLTSVNTRPSLELLSGLLENDSNYDYLNTLLQSQEIQALLNRELNLG